MLRSLVGLKIVRLKFARLNFAMKQVIPAPTWRWVSEAFQFALLVRYWGVLALAPAPRLTLTLTLTLVPTPRLTVANRTIAMPARIRELYLHQSLRKWQQACQFLREAGRNPNRQRRVSPRVHPPYACSPRTRQAATCQREY